MKFKIGNAQEEQEEQQTYKEITLYDGADGVGIYIDGCFVALFNPHDCCLHLKTGELKVQGVSWKLEKD